MKIPTTVLNIVLWEPIARLHTAITSNVYPHMDNNNNNYNCTYCRCGVNVGQKEFSWRKWKILINGEKKKKKIFHILYYKHITCYMPANKMTLLLQYKIDAYRLYNQKTNGVTQLVTV